MLLVESAAIADAAATSPTVADIFARHEAAVGYSLADGKEAPSIAYWTSSWKDVEGDPDGSMTVVHQAGAYYRFDSTYLGSITTGGFNGSTFWYGTSNDCLYPATGYTRPYDITSAIVNSEAFDAALNAKLQQTTDSAYVVRIQPASGIAADVYFNKTTSYIDRVVYDPDGFAVLDQFRDYRAEGPVTVAHTRQSYDTTSTLTEFHWNAQFDPSELAPPATHRFLWLPTSGTTTVPFDQHGGVVIEASVDGQGGHMLLNTSTEGIQLSKHFAKIAGLKLPENSKVFEASPTVGAIDVGDMHLRNIHVDVVNGNFYGPYDGILGSDVFSNTIVTIDFDKKTVTFADPASFHDDGSRPSFNLSLDDSVPQMMVTANGKSSFPVVVASGDMFQMTLHDKFVDAHRDVTGATSIARYGVLDMLTIGPFSIPKVDVGPTYELEGFSYIPIAPGYLGATVLSAFNMTFDYPDHKLFLTPNGSSH
jgi:hypothetical protein